MRLLLAEDEKELSDALTAILRHNNYSVDAVYNGIDALDFLTAQDYDGAILTFGDLSLNCATFDMYSDKGSFRLTNKEFQMLELLISNPGQVISTERFWEKIWEYNSGAEIGVVWVYISNLRKKLASLSSNVQIRTARNQGYSLEAVK